MQDDDRFIILAVMDVDEQMKEHNAAAQMKEEQVAYNRISALAGDFFCIYIVDPETGQYREFSATAGFDVFELPDETEKPLANPQLPSPVPSKKPEVSDKKNPTASPNTSVPYPTHTMPKQEPPATTAPPTEPPQSPASVDLSACLSQNRDFIAWLTIPGTPIDYPVVRSNNTEHYLTHMFSGKESKLGTLFSLRNSDYQSPSKNIAIYGHHLSQSTAMFSTLMRYKNASYCAGHSTIQLDSLYGSRNYRIFAVVNMSVSDWDASTASFSSNESFLYFVNRARRSALYDTGVQVNEDDHILTLITCDRSYGGATGRLLVMAVQQ
jgi:sortase B